MARHNPPNNPGALWGGLTPIPEPRKYPVLLPHMLPVAAQLLISVMLQEWNEEGLRELFLSINSRDLTWESFHRATIRCMDNEERDKCEQLFKQEDNDYKKRSPSMKDFIETALKIPFLGEWEFDRQDNMQAFTLNMEHRVELAILMDGAPKNYTG